MRKTREMKKMGMETMDPKKAPANMKVAILSLIWLLMKVVTVRTTRTTTKEAILSDKTETIRCLTI